MNFWPRFWVRFAEGTLARSNVLEEDKRATTDVQNGLVFFFLIIFKKRP